MSETQPPDSSPPEALDISRRFASVERALGVGAFDLLAQAHVVVAGIGGVGAWAAEALARSAVGRLSLIDLDHVAESNINRQVHALSDTVGQAKVLAMRDRIAQINPRCQVHAIDAFVEPETIDEVMPEQVDVVLDCTDQLHAKVAMVLWAKRHAKTLLVCGAAGGKTDPLTLRLTDLRDSSHDALLARMRTVLRQQHGFAAGHGKRVAPMGVKVLWFSQPAKRPVMQPAIAPAAGTALACAGYGSLVTVTASMGFAAAAYALDVMMHSGVVSPPSI